VLDVWFDSGSMPFAQVHYPFENQEWFDTHNPADFIVEYIGQTRGWFYTMHVLSTALFDRPAYKNVISHGIVLGSDGQKMSKSLRNYPDVSEVFDRDGADAMRWFLMSSSVIRGGNLVVTEEGIRSGVRELLLPLWSTYYFFALYANASDHDAHWASDQSENILDRYILAKTGELVAEVTTELEDFDSPIAAARLRDFADVLTNWYVRRSRDRFWQGDADAFDTLYTVLETVSRVAAPLIPLVSEEIWRGLTGGRSVHLENWPIATDFGSDPELVAEMDYVREIASSGLALRKARGLRVRLPLAKLTVVTGRGEWFEGVEEILRDELNVKTVQFQPLEEHSLESYGITRRLSVNARALGPRVGKDVQRIIQAAKAGDWSLGDRAESRSEVSASSTTVTAGGVELLPGEFELELDAADASSAITFLGDGGFVILDTVTTPELEAEGLARDVIRAIQDTRKAAGLEVSDRIVLFVKGSAESDIAALAGFARMIDAETLAVESEFEVYADPEAAAVLDSQAGARTVLAVGQGANAGVLVIDVWKSGAVNV
jgi:isoleucyl-tRNA synthetase